MVAIVVSVVLAVAGLWLALFRGGADVAPFGWVLVVVGLAFLALNLHLRRRGFRTPRRRP